MILSPCFSQENEIERLSYRSNMLGIGSASVYDTYLSPSDYSGISFSFMQENMKMTGMMNGNIAAQQLFNISFLNTENKAETSREYAGFIEYNYGLFYRLAPLPNLKVFAGSQINGLVGCIYNTRNSNNPVSAKAHLNLTLSGIAAYNFNIKSQPFRLRYQISSPFVGVMFATHYGQSYYEISLGVDDDLVYFSSFHNQLSLRNTLSLEIPLSFMTLRLAYRNTMYETKVNNLNTRIHDNSFMIGFSREFLSFSGKKQLKRNYNRVFE